MKNPSSAFLEQRSFQTLRDGSDPLTLEQLSTSKENQEVNLKSTELSPVSHKEQTHSNGPKTGHWKGHYRSEDFCMFWDCYSLKQLHQQKSSKKMHSIYAMKPKCIYPPRQQMHEPDISYTADMQQQRARKIMHL